MVHNSIALLQMGYASVAWGRCPNNDWISKQQKRGARIVIIIIIIIFIIIITSIGC